MSENHLFVDRKSGVVRGMAPMLAIWAEFFRQFPGYSNMVVRIESADILVVMQGYATWTEDAPPDRAIWTARLSDGKVAEWRIFCDSEENRRNLLLPLT